MLSQPTVGQIVCVPYTFNLENWLPCEGQLLPQQEYEALYTLLGNRFGGEASKNFALPDLRGKEPAPGLKWIIGIHGDYPVAI